MKNILMVLLIAAPLIPLAARAETIYLIIKSEGSGSDNQVALLKIPMESIEQCEEQGATLVSSQRFDAKYAKNDGFECIRGK